MSVRVSTSRPRACSGDMYCGVPMGAPVRVRCCLAGWPSPLSLAMPKSRRFGDEARHHGRVRRVLPVQHLDGDLLADERMGRLEDHAEAALAELTLDDEFAHERARLELGLGHDERGRGLFGRGAVAVRWTV